MLQEYQAHEEMSLRDLAEEFGYSIGMVSNFLLLAEGIDKYSELKNIKNVTAALKFLKRKKFRRGDD